MRDHLSLAHGLAQDKVVRSEDQDGGAMLEPAHLGALAEGGIAGIVRPASSGSRTERKVKRIPETRMAATATMVTSCPLAARRVRITARSFLQNSFSILASAIGFTFQVSPER
jgi:hypothetical protein